MLSDLLNLPSSVRSDRQDLVTPTRRTPEAPASPLTIDALGMALSLPWSYCLYDAGALMAAIDAKLPPDIAVGSGVGAFVAALYAGNEPSAFADQFISFWNAWTREVREQNNVLGLLERYVDFDRINRPSPVLLLLPTVELSNGRIDTFSNHLGRWRMRIRPDHVLVASGYGQGLAFAGLQYAAIPAHLRETAVLRSLGDAFMSSPSAVVARRIAALPVRTRTGAKTRQFAGFHRVLPRRWPACRTKSTGCSLCA